MIKFPSSATMGFYSVLKLFETNCIMNWMVHIESLFIMVPKTDFCHVLEWQNTSASLLKRF